MFYVIFLGTRASSIKVELLLMQIVHTGRSSISIDASLCSLGKE